VINFNRIELVQVIVLLKYAVQMQIRHFAVAILRRWYMRLLFYLRYGALLLLIDNILQARLRIRVLIKHFPRNFKWRLFHATCSNIIRRFTLFNRLNEYLLLAPLPNHVQQAILIEEGGTLVQVGQ
jgi:hypothetical protein